MAAREAILARLRAQKRAAAPPAPWRSRRSYPDLAAQFLQALKSVGGEGFHEKSLAAAWKRIDELFNELLPRQIVLDGSTPPVDVDFQSRYPEVVWHHSVDRITDGLAAWQAVCAAADLGISGAEAALAETGTVVLHSGPDRSRLSSLLPPVHLALVPEDRLYTDLFTWIAAREGAPPASITLVSGPSKTADIEQTLAIGVHGPKRFIVVLYRTER